MPIYFSIKFNAVIFINKDGPLYVLEEGVSIYNFQIKLYLSVFLANSAGPDEMTRNAVCKSTSLGVCSLHRIVQTQWGRRRCFKIVYTPTAYVYMYALVQIRER